MGVTAPPIGGYVLNSDEPPDDEGLDANCDGVDGVIGKDVYVNAMTVIGNQPGHADGSHADDWCCSCPG